MSQRRATDEPTVTLRDRTLEAPLVGCAAWRCAETAVDQPLCRRHVPGRRDARRSGGFPRRVRRRRRRERDRASGRRSDSRRASRTARDPPDREPPSPSCERAQKQGFEPPDSDGRRW